MIEGREEEQVVPVDCRETRVSEGRTGSSRTRKRCLDLQSDRLKQKHKDLHMFMKEF